MFWLLATLAYLLGSLSFAILLSRLTGNPDPRMSGSGNAGRLQHGRSHLPARERLARGALTSNEAHLLA